MKRLQKIKNHREPLYRQIADRMMNYILDNDLKPGTALPSQNALIKHFDVSQITVRQAMQQLIGEGIITSVQGKGTFVAETRGPADVDAHDAFHPADSEGHFVDENRQTGADQGHPTDSDAKQAEEKIKRQLQFERLISRLSAEFINLPSGQIDRKIDEALKLVVETLNIDRSIFHEFSEERGLLSITHFFIKPGVEPPVSTMTTEAQPWFTETVLNGDIIKVERIDNLPDEAELEKEFLLKQGVQSVVAIPMIVGKKSVGALTFATVFRERSWSDGLVSQLKLISEVFANTLDRKQKEKKLGEAFKEIKNLKDQLQKENIYLRQEVEVKYRHDEIIGKSEGLKRVLALAEKVAKQNTNVLILGETGTGKELMAHAIHNMSPRKKRAMIKVNCAALPASLIESELFGREKGAFTGAVSRRIGRFEAANGSTIFLDEIGEMPHEIQIKLLRVLQEGTFERLGSTESVTVDVRVIAATNQDLGKAAKKGKFRRDLYYRLNVFPMTIPPLRDRREDIPLLVWFFVREYEKAMGKKIESITEQTMDLLQRYYWAGNVRELRNVIERAMILNAGSVLRISRIESEETVEQGVTLDDVMRHHILKVLEETGWRVSGKNGAAEILGLKRTTLLTKMKSLNIQRPKE